MEDIIVAEKIVDKLDPQYLYFLDSEGTLRKRKKGGTQRKNQKPRKQIFTDLNLTIPKVLLKAYISGEKRVIKYGNSGAMISMPKSLIGFKGRVILIPNEALDDIKEGTLNLFK